MSSRSRSYPRKNRPDSGVLLKNLHGKNLHVTLNLHPASGVQYTEEQYAAMAERMGVDPAAKKAVEFDFTDSGFINAYFELLHKPYERDGVDFWWSSNASISSRYSSCEYAW